MPWPPILDDGGLSPPFGRTLRHNWRVCVARPPGRMGLWIDALHTRQCEENLMCDASVNVSPLSVILRFNSPFTVHLGHLTEEPSRPRAVIEIHDQQEYW